MDRLTIKNNQAQPNTSNSGLPPWRSQKISSDVLFAGARELVIEHAGNQYRLQLTKQDKLILIK